MKKHLFSIICSIIIVALVISNLNAITSNLGKILDGTPKVVIEPKNEYAKNSNYDFVQISEDFIPYNYQDLLNIFYTVMDAGYESFTFYCPSEYIDCINDVEKISNKDSSELLTVLSNYVSPFNSFSPFANSRVKYDTAGEVTIEYARLYDNEDIYKINQKIDSIWSSIVKDDMDKKDIINVFHDYIINTTKYDINYKEELASGNTSHDASRANGPLFEGYATCSGYTDVMAIVLDRLDLENFKVASETHVWNVVKIDGEWLHLDLTWDDPVSEDHSINNLLHKFSLIDTKTLESFDIPDHTFDKSIYTELA